jgi:hypothetical protein
MPANLALKEHLTYGITNRTMSYTRHNGASIDVEHVLAFEKVVPSITPGTNASTRSSGSVEPTD